MFKKSTLVITFLTSFLPMLLQAQNVGIGTKDPHYTLTVKDTLNSNLYLSFGVVSPDNSKAAGFFISNSAIYLQTHTDDDLYFTTGNGGAKMTLQKGTGYVGIGTANPGAGLDLVGPTAAISALKVTGNGTLPLVDITSVNSRALNITQNNTTLYALNVSGASTGTAIMNVTAPATGTAARFIGNLTITGDVYISGNLTKTSGTFKIDHPLDPANKFLLHSFVESPDMMNVYNGNITTNNNGKAIVILPPYFEAANKDFKYQLTVLGEFATAIISKKVAGNQFEIMTDKPGVEVSWQVIGVRNDLYAQKNRVVPEVDKKEREKGYYISPEAFGKEKSRSINYANANEINPE